MNLPDLYARVVAKRPELAVKNLQTSTNVWTEDQPPITVWIYGWTPKSSDPIMDHFAAALILAKWVEALPVRHGLDHHPADNRESEDWQVCWYTPYSRTGCGSCEATPLEALAAFYLGDSQ